MMEEQDSKNGTPSEDKIDLRPPVTITLSEMYSLLNSPSQNFSPYFNGGFLIDYELKVIPGKYDNSRSYEEEDMRSLGKLIAMDILGKKIVLKGKFRIVPEGDSHALELNLEMHSKTRWLLLEYFNNFNYLHLESMHSIYGTSYRGKPISRALHDSSHKQRYFLELEMEKCEAENAIEFMNSFNKELKAKKMGDAVVDKIDWKSPSKFRLNVFLSERPGMPELLEQYISLYNLTHANTSENRARRNHESAVEIISAELWKPE